MAEAQMSEDNTGLLTGLRVAAFAVDSTLPIPLTAKLLSELGAEVTVVRPPVSSSTKATGAASEWQFLLDLLAVGVRSIDLPNAAGDLLADPAFAELVRSADVVLAPQQRDARAFGIDTESVAQLNPQAIHASASAFAGEPGSDAWRSSDLVLQAMGGMLLTTGQPGEPPTRIGARVGDHLGALYLAIGSLAALMQRGRTGTGRTVTVSLVDAVASSLNNFIAEYKGKGHLPVSIGNRHLASSPWNTYPTVDGFVVLCLITDRQWDSLADLMGHPDLVGNPEFHSQQNRRPRADEIDKIVSAWTETRTVREVMDAAGARAIPCGEIPSIEDVLTDESLFDRGLFRRTDGTGLTVGPLVQVYESLDGESASGARPVDQPSDADSARPLDGVRVVEIGVAAAGPVAGRILANLGADVIKIEPAGGEIGRRVPPSVGTTSAVFHLNGGDKRSACLDLTTEPGRTVAERVIATADVLVENMAPGRLASWGLRFDSFGLNNPGLIHTSVSGFGQDSTGTKVRAYDTTVQAASGLLSVTGFPDGMPTKAGISLSDFFGGVSGALATTAALYSAQQRRFAGLPARSVHLDLSMNDVTVWTTTAAWPQFLLSGELPGRIGNLDRYVLWQDVVTCKDGQLALTLFDDADLDRLAALLPGIAARDAAGAPSAELVSALESWALDRTSTSAVDDLRTAGLAAGPLRNIIELVADEGIRARGVITSSVHPFDGDVAVMRAPIHFSDVATHVPTPAPVLGAHTTDVLRSVAGYSDDEVAELLAHPAVIQA